MMDCLDPDLIRITAAYIIMMLCTHLIENHLKNTMVVFKMCDKLCLLGHMYLNRIQIDLFYMKSICRALRKVNNHDL